MGNYDQCIKIRSGAPIPLEPSAPPTRPETARVLLDLGVEPVEFGDRCIGVIKVEEDQPLQSPEVSIHADQLKRLMSLDIAVGQDLDVSGESLATQCNDTMNPELSPVGTDFKE